MIKYSSINTRTTKTPRVGDIWLVVFPYTTPGNMEKIRPAIIKYFDSDDTVVVQKLTTKKKKGCIEFKHPKMKYKTYLSKEVASISDCNLIRRIGHI